MDSFTRGYVACAIWASTDDEGRPLDETLSGDDLAPEALAQMEADCQDFQTTNGELLTKALDIMGGLVEGADMLSYLGHDFWLTRNHHGAGFWDRGLGSVGDELTRMAHAYGEAYLYRGDDGKVYLA